MGSFFNNSKESNNYTGTTTIAAGTKITGEIEISCNLHIDGEFDGNVKSESFITIGKSGLVEGDILADKLVVSGKFLGSCECNTVEIMPEGKVEGRVMTKELVIERKGIFVGESMIKDAESNFETKKIENKESKKFDSLEAAKETKKD